MKGRRVRQRERSIILANLEGQFCIQLQSIESGKKIINDNLIMDITHQKRINFFILLLLLLSLQISCQAYQDCEEEDNEIGNETRKDNINIIELTSFLEEDREEYLNSYQQYIKNGNIQPLNSLKSQKRKLYIIFISLFSVLSVIAFVALIRMGKLSTINQQKFLEIKNIGFTSSLSAIFILIIFFLIVFNIYLAVEVPNMIGSITSTQCKITNANQKFLYGDGDWAGVKGYFEKIQSGKLLMQQLRLKIDSNSTFYENQTKIAYLKSSFPMISYLGIKDQYKNLTLSFNSSQKQSLAAFIPTFFTELTLPFQSYIYSLTNASLCFKRLQNFLNDTYIQMDTFKQISSVNLEIIKGAENNYTEQYTLFRNEVDQKFSDLKIALIFGEIIIVLTIICSIVFAIIFKLIQNRYDLFSINTFKFIWSGLLISFCLNLVFLLVFSQIFLENYGSCTFAKQVINNSTFRNEVLLESDVFGGQSLLFGCFDGKQFQEITQSEYVLNSTIDLANFYGLIIHNFSEANILSYSQIQEDISQSLLPYKFGFLGNWDFIDSQLANLNNLCFNDPYKQNCFKHNWQFSKIQCTQSQIYVLPSSSVISKYDFSNYSSAASKCFLLNNYQHSMNPESYIEEDFVKLYVEDASRCPQTVLQIYNTSNLLLNAVSKRQSIIDSYLSSIMNLNADIGVAVTELLTYISIRTPLLETIFTSATMSSNYTELNQGNNCKIIKNYVEGAYNQYCINFKAKCNQVFLCIICNLFYIMTASFFSFLYALQLKSMVDNGEKSDQELISDTKILIPELSESSNNIPLSDQ